MAKKINNRLTITIIYDNEAWNQGLQADWGFSCLVQAYGRKILFDTGARGDILFANMKKLHIDPGEIDEVFISHGHWDHVGGLADFLKINPVKVFIPASLTGLKGAPLIRISEPLLIHNNIFSTGELVNEEQSLVIKAEEDIVVIAGCSHPGVKQILLAASQFGRVGTLIGGLHGFNDFDLIGNLDRICPTHCTRYKSEIASRYPEKYIPGGAGQVIEVTDSHHHLPFRKEC